MEALESAVAGALARGDLHGALGLLSARVRYRYTGLYAFAPPTLRTVDLFDRENPSLRFTGCDPAIRETYCGIVRLIERPLVTTDARRDDRVSGHAACARAISYIGVPLRGPGGTLSGTLCHFDRRPRLAPAGEIEVLEWVAPLFKPWVADPPPAA